MLRPQWLRDAPPLTDCLFVLRDVGVPSLRLRRVGARMLDDACRTRHPDLPPGDQYKLVVTTLTEAIDELDPAYLQQPARVLFGLTHETATAGVRERRTLAASECNQSFAQFRRDDVGYERAILEGLASKIEQLAADRGRTESTHASALENKIGRDFAAELVQQRSVLHIARTLEARAAHLREPHGQLIETLIADYVGWHENPQSTQQLLIRLNDACKKYCGIPLFDLMGTAEADLKPPMVSPVEPVEYLNYPRDEPFVFIPGGQDPFTNQHVEPYYLAVYPVRCSEWQEFLIKFSWEETFPWLELLRRAGISATEGALRRSPAVGMTFYDCWAYCFWLWRTTLYRFRLPTEAEWNFGATGGALTRYPWGNNVDKARGIYARSTRRSQVAPVDAVQPAGPFDIVGQSGNVWEYVSTLWLGERPSAAGDVALPDLPFSLLSYAWWQHDERLELDEDDFLEEIRFTMKGGSWGGGPEYGTVDTRIYSSLYNLGEYGGVRLAISAVRDPITGDYSPEPSPYLHGSMQRARPLSAAELRDLQVEYSVQEAIRFANSTSCPTVHGKPLTKSDASSWEAIMRRGK